MTIRPRFHYIVGSIGVILYALVIACLAYNQIQLNTRLNQQALFDKQVMQNDHQVWLDIQKATPSATEVRPTPKPKLIAH